ncbi:kunitz-type protease inhibitor 4 [Sciurus carolinensis]|uniref:kunitz-type protease inhibitor 4 n=1 Tax=Sciurus carolinensis TaxID=30640 RepID=UPI001FB2413E|nr:kunitz-type protease inhibitor 4 [Sciurus carolinensis]
MKPEWICFSLWLFVFSMLFRTLSGAISEEMKKHFCPSGNLGIRPDYCNYPVKTGRCKLTLTRFYFNTLTHVCEPFIFSGCNGNRNNFKQKFICDKYCVSAE